MPRGAVVPPPDVLAQRPPLAREITARRVAAGLTQRQLADLIGCHVVSIGDMERGVFNPSEAMLAKVKAALEWD